MIIFKINAHHSFPQPTWAVQITATVQPIVQKHEDSQFTVTDKEQQNNNKHNHLNTNWVNIFWMNLFLRFVESMLRSPETGGPTLYQDNQWLYLNYRYFHQLLLSFIA